MENIRHSLDVLLPWQRPIPKDQKLKNKGNYDGNLTGKSQEQRLQDNRIRVSFVTLASSYSHFCRNTREPPLDHGWWSVRDLNPQRPALQSEVVFQCKAKMLHVRHVLKCIV